MFENMNNWNWFRVAFSGILLENMLKFLKISLKISITFLCKFNIWHTHAMCQKSISGLGIVIFPVKNVFNIGLGLL